MVHSFLFCWAANLPLDWVWGFVCCVLMWVFTSDTLVWHLPQTVQVFCIILWHQIYLLWKKMFNALFFIFLCINYFRVRWDYYLLYFHCIANYLITSWSLSFHLVKIQNNKLSWAGPHSKSPFTSESEFAFSSEPDYPFTWSWGLIKLAGLKQSPQNLFSNPHPTWQYYLIAILPTCHQTYLQSDLLAIWPICNVTNLQSDQLAIWSTYNLIYLQSDLLAIWSTYNLTYLQSDLLAIWRTCNVTYLQSLLLAI